MERPLVDALHAAQGLPAPSPSPPSSSRGPASLFPASGARERALTPNPTLASFPYEDVEPMRVHPPPSSASNPGGGVASASAHPSAASGAAPGGSSYVILPRLSPSPLTPRYLASVTHPPPPLGALLANATATGSACGTANDEAVNHYNRHTSVHNLADRGVSSVETQQQEIDQTANGLGGGVTAVATEKTASNGGMTMSAALAAIPASVARPLTIPPPSLPMTTHATKKRKRPSGALRLRNFLCTHPGCGKSFTDSAHLRDHTVVHTGEKNLSCPVCDKKFARVSSLREHQRVHTGEKPYMCAFPECGKCYSSRAALRFHVSSHLPQLDATVVQTTNVDVLNGVSQEAQLVPFVCQECGKHFRVRELLMAHRKVHDAHRAAAALELEPPSPQSSTSSGTDRPTTGEQGSYSDTVSLSDENRILHDTIRAQQQEIDRLKAEVQWLRQQASRDLVDTTVRRSESEEPQAAVSLSGMPPPAMKTEPRALTAPVEMLRDGVKPFQCCICHNRFANFYQLTFHGKQHPTASASEVTGSQAPLPVGPKYCPEEKCEYSEATGKSLRNLQTLKRHWQRRHQNDRPYACLHCPPTHQKTFKTRENLKAHEKDCTRNLDVR